eukprot:859361_1
MILALARYVFIWVFSCHLSPVHKPKIVPTQYSPDVRHRKSQSRVEMVLKMCRVYLDSRSFHSLDDSPQTASRIVFRYLYMYGAKRHSTYLNREQTTPINRVATASLNNTPSR